MAGRRDARPLVPPIESRPPLPLLLQGTGWRAPLYKLCADPLTLTGTVRNTEGHLKADVLPSSASASHWALAAPSSQRALATSLTICPTSRTGYLQAGLGCQSTPCFACFCFQPSRYLAPLTRSTRDASPLTVSENGLHYAVCWGSNAAHVAASTASRTACGVVPEPYARTVPFSSACRQPVCVCSRSDALKRCHCTMVNFGICRYSCPTSCGRNMPRLRLCLQGLLRSTVPAVSTCSRRDSSTC